MSRPSICARKYSVSETTFYKWKAKFEGISISDARRLKALEDENRQLKQIAADQSLDIQVLTSERST